MAAYGPEHVVPLLLDVTDEEGVQRAVGQVEATLAKRGVKLVRERPRGGGGMGFGWLFGCESGSQSIEPWSDSTTHKSKPKPKPKPRRRSCPTRASPTPSRWSCCP